VQQTLDALLHSGRTEACLVTALADQLAQCYHNQVVTVPVQPSGTAVLSTVVETDRQMLFIRRNTANQPKVVFQHVYSMRIERSAVSVDMDAKIPD